VAEEPKPEKLLDVHGPYGVDFTTHHISRGLVLQDQGFIAQRYMELGFTLFEDEGAGLSKFTAFGGIWNSLHGNKGRPESGRLRPGHRRGPDRPHD
jgi:hypothetical protein